YPGRDRAVLGRYPRARTPQDVQRERGWALPPSAARYRAAAGLRRIGMAFRPSADRLVPELTPAEEIVLLARTLWREGYRDHLAGHITRNMGDGTLLCNPWLLTWPEFGPGDVLRIDLDGTLLEGQWPVPLGIPLHLALHRARPDVQFVVHNHPEFGTIWGDLAEVPPAYDQSSSLGGGELVLVDEY